MSTQPFSVLYHLIRPFAKRVTQLGMDSAILDAARDFCMKSKMRRASMTLNLNALFQYYDLTGQPLIDAGGSADEEVLYLNAATILNQYGRAYTLSPVQPEQVNNFCDNTSGQWPRGFWLVPVSQIALWPVPQMSVTGGLQVRAILQPNITATTLDASLIQMADRTIAYGALERLLMRNDEPYSNAALSLKYGAKYKAGCDKGMTDAEFSYAPFNQTSAVYRW